MNTSAAKCWFRDEELAKAFSSLRSAQIADTTSAIIIRQILGEMLAGVSTETGSTGFKNPISLSGERSLGELFQGFGLPVQVIGKITIQRGGKFSDVRAWIRAYSGESLINGTFLKKELLEEWATRIHYDDEGDSYTRGILSEDGRVTSFDGHKVSRVGKVYFIYTSSYWHYGSEGKMWVRTNLLKR